MDADKDRKGYYARLNVAPLATAEEIKAAYRLLAKKLHPDINRDASAKTQFQAISEAYNVLSDPQLRSNYDALRYTNPSPHPREQELDPICCSRCGRVTAQPRSTVFYRVVSVLVIESLRTEYTSTQIIRSRLSYTLYSVPSGNVRPQGIEPVEFAGLDVTLDLAIEAIGLELFEPGAELRVLVGRQACDGFLEVFDAHNADIICDFSHSSESFPRFLIDFRCSRDAANLNIRCRNCRNSPRTRSNSAAPRSSNRVHPL